MSDRQPTLTPRDFATIQHSLCGSEAVPYRNFYAAVTADFPRLDALVARGLLRPGLPLSYGRFYHVTAAGAKAVGLALP